MMYLIILLIISVIAIINIIFINRNSKNIFNVSLFWSLTLLLYFTLFFILNVKLSNFQFSLDINWLIINTIFINWNNLIFSIDGLSIFFIVLSILLIPISNYYWAS